MLLEHPVIFFGGKGGVGKTTLAAATALSLDDALLVSTDPAHNIGHVFDVPVGDEPTKLREGLYAVEIDPTATTDAHIKRVEHTMRQYTPERLHRQIRAHMDLARTSPGMHEAAMLERIAQIVINSEHKHVVVDTAPTGHTTRLLALPELMSAWVDGLLGRRGQSERFGELVRGLGGEDPIRRRDEEIRHVLNRRKQLFGSFRDLIKDPDKTAFALVTIPERVPVTESLELAGALHQMGVHLGGIYINRCSPTDQGPLLAERAHEEAAQIGRLEGIKVAQQKLPLLADASPKRVAELLRA
ncbi:ArsA family ATPase [Corynebacterium mayonis]|uniref:ArsA family ATPase n=1 Tax=Corynebacterium mayonis TaxID=3062461 RepID=UPI00314071A4